MTAKLIKDLPINQYHGDLSTVSKSGLDKVLKSPLHYWHHYINPDKQQESAKSWSVVGNAYHTLLLEPLKFDEEYAVLPKGLDRRTKAGKETYSKFLDEAKGKMILSDDEHTLVRRMVDSMSKHKEFMYMLDGFGTPEASIFFEVEGVSCRIRPDYITDDGYILDLKTSRDAVDYRGFKRSMYKYNYHMQAAFYSRGFKEYFGDMPRGFIFGVTEKSGLNASAVYQMDFDSNLFESAEFMYHEAINTYKLCKANNVWPSYNQDKIQMLGDN